MADDLIPSGGDNAPYKKPDDEGEQYRHNQLDKIYTFCQKHGRTIGLVIAFMVFIEFATVLFWHLADVSHGVIAGFLNWISICGQVLVFLLPISKCVKKPYVVWLLFISLCICIGVYIFVFNSNQSEYQLPLVNLEIGPTLDPKDPWGQSFFICNQGKQPISNILADAYWNNPDFQLNQLKPPFLEIEFSTPINNIIPTMKATLNFDNSKHSAADPFSLFKARTYVELEIKYTPYGAQHETNQTFQFSVTQDNSGNYIWLPTGAAPSFENIIKRTYQLNKRLIEDAPYISLGIDSVEDVSQSRKDYPIKITFFGKNTSRQPATNVYVQWGTMTTNNSVAVLQDQHDQMTMQFLKPGMESHIVIFYAENQNHDIFSRIMSGDLGLVGTVFFADLHDHVYAVRYTAIKTSNNFEMGKSGMDGYYRDIVNNFEKTNRPPK